MLSSPLAAPLGWSWDLSRCCGRGNPPKMSLLLWSISVLPAPNQLGRDGMSDEAPSTVPPAQGSCVSQHEARCSDLPALLTLLIHPQVPALHSRVPDLLRGQTCHRYHQVSPEPPRAQLSGLCLQNHGSCRDEQGAPARTSLLLLQLCEESGFSGSLCRVLEGQRFLFSALGTASLSRGTC